MKIEKAIQILKAHNEWRRGGESEPTNPTELGEAIDTVVNVDNEWPPRQQLFNHMAEYHDLILVDSELQDIINCVKINRY